MTRDHSSYLISSGLILTDFISSKLSGGQCVVKRPSSPWLRRIGDENSTRPTCFTSHSLPLGPDELR